MNVRSGRSNGGARVLAILAAAIVVAASPGAVQAAEKDDPSGRHVSECAQASLGKRAYPPETTCSHDGHMHVVANFGAMAKHMHEHHGS